MINYKDATIAQINEDIANRQRDIRNAEAEIRELESILATKEAEKTRNIGTTPSNGSCGPGGRTHLVVEILDNTHC